MTVSISNTALATALVGSSVRTPGQEGVALAKEDFRGHKSTLWQQYSGEVARAKAPLVRALEDRALERLSLKAALEIDRNVGGGTDIKTEAAGIQDAITGVIRANVEARSGQIKAQKEEQHATTIGTSVNLVEGKVNALLTATSTDSKRVNTDLLRALISLVIKDNASEALTPEVLIAFANEEQAINALTETVLVKFKPKAASDTVASSESSS